jgi:hypothetical protein
LVVIQAGCGLPPTFSRGGLLTKSRCVTSQSDQDTQAALEEIALSERQSRDPLVYLPLWMCRCEIRARRRERREFRLIMICDERAS